MFERQKQLTSFVLFLCCFVPILLAIAHAQDEAVDKKIVERYKQMLNANRRRAARLTACISFTLKGQA